MTTFEVDAVIIVEADDDGTAEGIVLEALAECTNSERIKAVEVAYIADTNTYGK